MKMNIIALGTLLLLLLSIVTPMTLGIDTDTTVEDEYLKDLDYVLSDKYGSAKYEYFKDYLQGEDTDIGVESDIVTKPIEIPSNTMSGPPMDSVWPMQCFDTHHTSRSPYSTAHIEDLEKWRFKVGPDVQGGLNGGICIDNNGVIYFGDTDGYIYALYPNGTEKWRYKTDMWITSTPALAEDGTLYVTSWDHYLYAFNSSTGKIKWRYNVEETIASSPAIGEDGTIYFGTMWDLGSGGKIYAIHPNGWEKWKFNTGYHVTSSPAIGDDGTIYIGSGDTYLYAMYPNGTLRWRFKTDDYIKGPPSIAEDGTVYINSYDDHLYAIFPNNGTLKWKCKFPYGSESNPSIASDGTIYFGSYKKLHAVYPNGTIRWSFNLGSETSISWSCPAISADGTIYVGTKIDSVYGGDILAINPDGAEKWRKRIADEWVDSSPSIGEDGTVYIGSYSIMGGYLHAFGPVESNVPPETPTISGPTNGEIDEEYLYELTVIDQDNNPISFYIDWDDGTNSGWTFERASGEKCYYSHTWIRKGNYTIKAKARDTLGEESDWSYLEINIPRNKQIIDNLFLRFLENHPQLLSLLI
jgi:outer membrane protein assembly factor BamB